MAKSWTRFAKFFEVCAVEKCTNREEYRECCRYREEFYNQYLLAEIGFDTAGNEPLEVWR